MATASPTTAPVVERRVVARRQPAQGTVYHLASALGKGALGLVWNLSATGVSMLLHERLEPGTTLQGELMAADETTVLPLTARVAHVSRIRTGDYFIGARFQRDLTADELRPFLGRSAD